MKDKLQLELGRAPTKEELATAAGCTLDQLKACLEQGAVSVSSLDHLSGFGRVKPGGGSGLRKEGCVADEGDSFPRLEMQMLPQAKALAQGQGQEHLGWDSREVGMMAMVDQGTEAEFMQISLREDLRYALFRLLDATERQCLVLRYGLQDGAPKSVEETAEIMEFCDPDDVRCFAFCFSVSFWACFFPGGGGRGRGFLIFPKARAPAGRPLPPQRTRRDGTSPCGPTVSSEAYVLSVLLRCFFVGSEPIVRSSKP